MTPEKLREKRREHPLLQMPEAEREAYLHDLAVGQFLAGLSVTPSPRSRVIGVSFSSPDPEFAARAANAAAEVYILDQLSQKGEATPRSSSDVHVASARRPGASRWPQSSFRLSRALRSPSNSPRRIEIALDKLRIEESPDCRHGVREGPV